MSATDEDPVSHEANVADPSDRPSPPWYKSAERFLARIPPARMTLAGPRTADWMVRSWRRRRRRPSVPGPPAPKLSVGLTAQVAMDESILTLAMAPSRFPGREDYLRGGAEMAAAQAFYADQGWLDAPLNYHQDPPPLGDDVFIRPARSITGLRYERLSFESGFEPHVGEPAGDRWRRYVPNRTAYAWVLRHEDDRPRPWLVCLHGFMMGYPFTDFPAFKAARLFKDLGVNLIFPTLPLHGPRKVGTMSGDGFMTYELLNAVLGVAHSIWDIRRVISWVQTQKPTAIGAYGISLGSCVTGLLAGLEPALDCAVLGVPVCDIPNLFGHHSPKTIRERAYEHGVLGPATTQVWSVVSPLSFEALVPRDKRFIYAGLGDRMAIPPQAHKLWLHWDQPTINWYKGNHVGFMWTRGIENFVIDSLTDAGFRHRSEPDSDDLGTASAM